jgi:hypothetical protein
MTFASYRRGRLSLRVFIFLLFPLPALAQVTTADVVGTVSDSTGAYLPGVTVTARREATGNLETAVTDGNGNFQILRLAPGPYRLTTELQGFKTVDSSVTLAIGDRYRLNMSLAN